MGFPECTRAIDGTHIPIVAPPECHIEYVNRKGYHCIIMQAVVAESPLKVSMAI